MPTPITMLYTCSRGSKRIFEEQKQQQQWSQGQGYVDGSMQNTEKISITGKPPQEQRPGSGRKASPTGQSARRCAFTAQDRGKPTKREDKGDGHRAGVTPQHQKRWEKPGRGKSSSMKTRVIRQGENGQVF